MECRDIITVSVFSRFGGLASDALLVLPSKWSSSTREDPSSTAEEGGFRASKAPESYGETTATTSGATSSACCASPRRTSAWARAWAGRHVVEVLDEATAPVELSDDKGHV